MRNFFFVVLAGCSMYGAPPDHLHNPAHVRPPAGSDAGEPAIAYVDDCATDFHRDARAVHPQPKLAADLVKTGDTTRDAAAKATGSQQAELLVSAIQHYADALRADPYDANATLDLAVAYDRVLRKGCALALLRRLDSLAQNPHVAPDAGQRVADVVDNPQWFKGYRKDALAAVDH
jgi:hypothetical protein